MNELLKNISCDHYQDDIVLMDEAQMDDNRRRIVDSINSLIQHRDADYYADRLHVSKQHLSACVSRTTGSTVTEHLARHVAIWAKKRLAHSNMSVEQIAAELNFANASHFGTYFKRTVGLSPSTYRKTKRK